MPASVADPVACVLRTALSGKKGPFSSHDETENGPELLEDRLAASAKRVLLSTVEYEAAPKQQVFSTDSLKSKYTVLSSSSIPSAKLAAINGIISLLASWIYICVNINILHRFELDNHTGVPTTPQGHPLSQ